MRILAFDATALAASVALIDDDKLVAEFFLNTGLTHSQTLLPMCEQLLALSKTPITEIDLLAVTAGPGSFTGVRIAISTLKGLAFGRNIKCVPVSSLESLAYNCKAFDGVLCPVMDARCGQVYNALFEAADGGITRLTPDRALSINELEKELIISEKKVILIGDGAILCYNTFKTSKNISVAPENLLLARASSAAYLARGCSPVSAEELSAFYLRLPQAEREREERLRKENTTTGGKKDDCYCM